VRIHFDADKGTRNNRIGYDFKDRRVIPTHYSIRSRYDRGVGGRHPKSWLIETSLNGKDWMEIDHRENNSELNAKNVTATFSISKREICRFLRLVNIGRNHQGNDALVISSFEIFGSLAEPR
jgi:hypothetical protein